MTIRATFYTSQNKFGKYVPDYFLGGNSVLTGHRYINGENIESLDRPIKAEENETGVFMLFKTKKDYLNQFIDMVVSFSVSENVDMPPSILLEIGNKYYDRDTYLKYFADAERMKNNYISYAQDPQAIYTKDFNIENYSHPLFDKAYIVNYKIMLTKGSEFDYWEFLGYKIIDAPFEFYDFQKCETEISNENLKNYLSTAYVLEFSINCNPQNAEACNLALNKAELVKVAEKVTMRD